ncbi:MAG: YhjD/YihY/BrkB family envelope integrity protein [Woeseiaceae bacterium]|nr:YhjD/YihY/BrkB family envelope integrity protein [Woeseiaceae bacterium]
MLDSTPLSPLVGTLGKLMPYFIVSAVFTFLYKYMPNTQVNLSAALVGGLAGGFIWASMGAFFTSFVVQAARIQLVDSGFAVAITALIWLYLNWVPRRRSAPRSPFISRNRPSCASVAASRGCRMGSANAWRSTSCITSAGHFAIPACRSRWPISART